jgi:nickel-dependent lactate racemase
MKTHLAYGKCGLDLSLDDRWDVRVIEPRFVPALADPQRALRDALKAPFGCPPLEEFIDARDTVGVIISDLTRATPSEQLLKALLSELPHVPRQNIRIFVALGTHRPNTPAELERMLGAYAGAGFEVIQNDAFTPNTQVSLGFTSRGNEIWINRELARCSVKLLTGFIEPHCFAGFSGAGKAIMPGMAGLETVMRNHSAQNIADPRATWGVTWGNPVWEEVREAALRAGRSFLFNVTMNRNQKITGVFAGDLDRAHEHGVEFARQTAMAVVKEPFDIVVATNSGHPLDLNLYQTVKGMSAAAQIVRQGGAILMASECWDGIPEHGMYGELLRQSGHPRALLEMISAPDCPQPDQWQAQIQAQIQLKADVYLHSGHLTEEQIRGAMLNPAPSLEGTLAELMERYGQSARICVLPEGPQTIPCLGEGRRARAQA